MIIYKYADIDHSSIAVIEGGKTVRCILNGIVPRGVTILPFFSGVSEWKAYLKERTTAQREKVEKGGITVNGNHIKTDSESQAKLTGALAFVGRSPQRQIKWKGADNAFTVLNKAQIEAISDAVGEFVALCYDAEAAHYDSIDALLTTDECTAYLTNTLTTGWPNNGN